MRDWHKIDTSGSGFVLIRTKKNPGALAGATGGKSHKKAFSFSSLNSMVASQGASLEANNV